MLNHIVLMGRLVRDPELRHTQNGVAVVSFTLAVDRDYKNQAGEKECDFVDITAWRSTAEFVSRYFGKGRMAVVSGRLQSRKWTDRDGNNRTSWEVQAESVYFGDSRRESGGAYGPPDAGPAQYAAAPPDVTPVPGEFSALDGAGDGDLPF